LMIAGLISRRDTASTSKIPWLGEFPVIGTFFSRKRYEEAETELVVMVTPEYVSPLDANDPVPLGPGENTTRPTDRELFFDGLLEVPKYGDPAEFAPPPPMYHQHYTPIPTSPYMRPPESMNQGSMESMNPQLPPAPAIEAHSAD